MNNPFSLLRLLTKAVRPSRTANMTAVSDAFWLRRGYDALTFFGFIVTHSRQEADHINSHYDELKNHEMIHLRQAQATGDSWIRFYLLYIWYCLRALPMNRHMNDLGYADRCKEGAQEWRRYVKMGYRERRAVYDKIINR